MMIRVSVLYPYQDDAKFDYTYYVTKHMVLVKERLADTGLLRIEADKAIGGGDPNAPAPFLCVGHMYFNSIEDFQKGMATHGKELLADVPNYTNVRPQIQLAEIEEI